MVKMQIIMDREKISRERQYDFAQLSEALDRFLVDKLKFIKSDNGFYLGTNAHKDYAHCGVAMNRLRRESWFIDNVQTWLFYINNDYGAQDDFSVEDMKEFCREHAEAAV
jgi:hypothetical protein